MLLSASTAGAATFTVNSIADPGSGNCNGAECTLREAIAAANGSAGADTIVFALPGPAPNVISVASNLPAISEALTIDGYTQAGSSPNTTVTGGLDTVITVELTRVASLGTGTGLGVSASDVTIRGLAIGGFFNGIVVASGVQNVTIAGNFLGTDIDGTFPMANANAGVFVNTGAQNVTIGGALPEDRNLISGNTGGLNTAGVVVSSGAATSTVVTIASNLIGTDPTGAVALPNASGIRVATGSGGAVDTILIGGADSADGNVIAGNDLHGINVVKTGATSEPLGGQNRIESNLIGVAPDGITPIPNLGNGIWFSNTSRSRWVVTSNVIAFNALAGVQVNAQIAPATGVGDTITQNSIHSNGGLGIDLDNVGVAPNDLDDPDGGGNSRQNYPLLDEAILDGSALGVFGLLNSTPATSYTIEFFDNEPTDTPDTEGRTFLGDANVVTGGAGTFTPFAVFLAPVAAGRRITATATDDQGNTSEFAVAVVVQVTTTTTVPSSSTTTITTTSTTLATSTTSTTVAPTSTTSTTLGSTTTTSTTVPPSTTSTSVPPSTTSTTVVPTTTSTSVPPTTTSTSTTTTTSISPLCGNGMIDSGEECDTNDFGSATCPGSSVIGAFLVCNGDCTIDFSNCPVVTTTSTIPPSTTSTTVVPSTTTTSTTAPPSTTSTTIPSTTSTTAPSTTSTTLASTTSTTLASTTSTTLGSTTTTSTTVPPSTTSTTVPPSTTSTTVPPTTSTTSTSSTTTSSTSTSSTTLATTTSTTTLPTTTSTSTTTSTTSTTSTTLPGLVPGGKKTNSDCYLELAVQGVVNDGVQVVDNKTVLCTDGTACDVDGQCDNVCTFRLGACINQNDPNLADCTPPAGLDSVRIKGKVTVAVPALLEGSACGAFVEAPVEAKFNRKGKYLSKKSKLKLKGKAKAPKGTQPRTDADAWTFQCVPNTNCPG